uniref:Uncharacterized protein n=1 Tax=Oryza brachyantha TaxID=4533 RepID=J3LPR1_ORYBR
MAPIEVRFGDGAARFGCPMAGFGACSRIRRGARIGGTVEEARQWRATACARDVACSNGGMGVMVKITSCLGRAVGTQSSFSC